jgi:uncharacterized RDD family membrane protein YckC
VTQPSDAAGGPRLPAALIDGATLTGVLTVVALPAFVLLIVVRMPDFAASTDPYAGESDPAAFLTGLVLSFLLVGRGLVLLALVLFSIYYVELLFRSGQTVGKKVMRIRIVPLDPAAALTRTMAAKRYLVEFVVGVVPLFRYLDGLWQLWDKPYQQTLHDKAAGTVVVKVPA